MDHGGSPEMSFHSASSSTDSETVNQRLRELESDPDNGWFDEDRHEFFLVRVPSNFLQVLRYQVWYFRAVTRTP
jgi:hypothetical protein